MRSFEDSLNAHKSELTEALIVFGEHKRVNKVLAEVESQRPDFYKFYKEGLESRQNEVDELQKQNAWLSGVAERENKRANNLQQDKTSTTILLGKTIQEKNELTKQRDSFIKAYEIEMDKSVDLQKRVDALIQKYKDEDRELKLIDEWEKSQIYGLVASELEQVLKGGRE